MKLSIIPCSKWSPAPAPGSMGALAGAGRCSMRGKTVTHSVCLITCKDYDGPPELQATARDHVSLPVLGGAMGSGGGCCGASAKAPIQSWARMRWHGVPKPVRWWKTLRKQEYKTEGCGCPVKTKAAFEGFKLAWRYFRSA